MRMLAPILACALAACSSGESESAKPAAAESYERQETVFDDQLQALERARRAEETVLQRAEEMKRAVREHVDRDLPD